MFFWNSLAFLVIQWMLAIWSLVPLPFLKPPWPSGSSRSTYCWSLAWRILSFTLLECEMSAIVWEFEHSLALPFFGIGMKTDLFQSCGHSWIFQIWKTIALTRWIFVSKVISLLFNMSSRLVIAFLPRSKCLLISWLQSPFAVILEPQK